MADNFQDLLKGLKVEIDPEEVEESIKTLQEKVRICQVFADRLLLREP